MTISAAAPALTDNYVLSEGPVWDADSGRLTWVDIEAGAVLSAPLTISDGPSDAGAPVLGAVTRVDVGEYVGCALPLEGRRTLVALTRRLAIVEADGSLTVGSELIPAGTRFNDGKIDPGGRLVVGSLGLAPASAADADAETGTDAGTDAVSGGEPDAAADPAASHVLLRVEHDGTVTTLDDDLRLSNGLGWSPDGRTLYSTDTESLVIFRRAYDPSGRGVGEREVFISLAELPSESLPQGSRFADGLTVDAEGRLWVAFWGGHGVRVFDADGALVPGLGIDAEPPHTSSITFAGPDLSVAVVTSASRDLSEEELHRWPHAGGLFLARPGAVGQPATRWREVALP